MQDLSEYTLCLLEAEEETIDDRSNDINNETPEETEQGVADPISGGIDAALAGEIRYSSMNNALYDERKRLIAQAFRRRFSIEDINADYISKTLIFNYYIRDLIKFYKDTIDANYKMNLSSKDELKRLIANDIMLIAKDMELN